MIIFVISQYVLSRVDTEIVRAARSKFIQTAFHFSYLVSVRLNNHQMSARVAEFVGD